MVVKGAREFAVCCFDSDIVSFLTLSFQSNSSPSNDSFEPASVVISKFDAIATIRSGKIDLQSKAYSTEFQTDSSIKKHGDLSFLEGRDLQSVSNAWLDPSTATSLASTSKSTNWDQFETNKRLFQVKSSYDENLYTKKIDYSSITSEQLAYAERMAREIEGQTSSNIHVQEERGQVIERDIDEEDRFSGVVRTPTTPASTGSSGGIAPKTAWDRGQKIGAAAAGPPAAGAAGKAGSKAATPKANSGSTPTKVSYASAATGSSAPASSEVSPSSSGKLAPPPNLSLQPGGSSTAAAAAASNKPLPPPPALSPATKPPSASTVTTTSTVTAVSTATTVSVTTDAVATTTTTTTGVSTESAAKPEGEPATAAAAATTSEAKPAAKLNANAKPFEFKATAKEFVPTFLKAPAVPLEAPATPIQQLPPTIPPQVMSPPVGVVPMGAVPMYPQGYAVPGMPPTPPAVVPSQHFKQSPHQPPMGAPSPVAGGPVLPPQNLMPMVITDPFQYEMMMQQQHQYMQPQFAMVPPQMYAPVDSYGQIIYEPAYDPYYGMPQPYYGPPGGYPMNPMPPNVGNNGQYVGGNGGNGGYPNNPNGQYNKDNR